MATPPVRNKAGDVYADAHNIRYEEGRMVCQRVHWEYRIYYPKQGLSNEYGTIGDIAVDPHGLVWYRDLKGWDLADDHIEDRNLPRQKHPLLKGRYRLDSKRVRWKGATCFYQTGRKAKAVKTEPGSVEKRVQAVKREPTHSEISTKKPPSPTAPKEERETIFIDLALKENGPLRRFAFLLPHASSSTLAPLPNPPPTPSAALEPIAGPSSIPPVPARATLPPKPPSSVPATSPSEPTPPKQPLETGTTDAPLGSSLQSSLPVPVPVPEVDEEEEFDFQYPEFQLANPIPLPSSEPRKLQDAGVQTEDMQHPNGIESSQGWISDGRSQASWSIQSDVHRSSRESPSASGPTFSDPDATLVHLSPPPGIGSSKTSALDLTLPSKDGGASYSSAAAEGSKSQTTIDGKVELLLERLFVESTKDRRDMLSLIQMMGQRLERLEDKQLRVEGLRYSMDINRSRDNHIVRGDPDMFRIMGQGNDYGSTSTPRGVRSSMAELMEGVVSGYYLGATPQGPSMVESKKRKLGEVEPDEVGGKDTSVKKSRIIT